MRHNMVDFTTSEEQEYLLQACRAEIQKQFKLISADLEGFSVCEFVTLNHYSQVLNRGTYQIKDSPCYAVFVEVELQRLAGKHGIITEKHLQLFVVVKSDRKFPHTLVRKETIQDKISEFFKSTEIDFPDDLEFSSKYFVLSDNTEQAVSLLSRKARSAIVNASSADLTLEWNGQFLVISNKQSVNSSNSIALIQLALSIIGNYGA
jgi:hypothetical protein